MSVRNAIGRIIIVWVLILVIVVIFGRISFAASNSGRTAADFLNIDLDARATGMGGAYSAISDGAISTFWNPAGLGYVADKEVTLGHFDWYQDMSVEYGSFAFRFNEKTTIAASIVYLNYGQITRYDNLGIADGDIDVYDWAGGVSLAYNVDPDLQIGLSGKFINQKIDDISGFAFAVDLGVSYSINQLRVSGYLGNVGTKMKYESESFKLPATGRLGFAYTPDNNMFILAFELDKPFSGDLSLKQGMEFTFEDNYFLRAGYDYYPTVDNYSFSDGLSFGGGIKFRSSQFDYSYSPSSKITGNDLHRFSLTFGFQQ